MSEAELMQIYNVDVARQGGVINNNHSGNQSQGGFYKAYGGKPTEKSVELRGLSKINFAKVAEAFGATGIRVERPAELKGAIAQATASGGKPHRCRDGE